MHESNEDKIGPLPPRRLSQADVRPFGGSSAAGSVPSQRAPLRSGATGAHGPSHLKEGSLPRSRSKIGRGESVNSISIEGSIYSQSIRKTTVLNRRSPRRFEDNASGAVLSPEKAAYEQDISVDPTMLDPYLLALSVCKFQFNVWIREFVCHSLQLLVLFALGDPRARLWARNRAFIGATFGCAFQWATFSAIAGISAIMYFEPPSGVGTEEYVFIILAWFFRHLVIATKYAFVSPLEMQEMSEKVEDIEHRLQRQARELLETQILLSSVRQSVDLTSGVFSLVNPKLQQAKPSEGQGPQKPVVKTAVITDIHTRYEAFLERDHKHEIEKQGDGGGGGAADPGTPPPPPAAGSGDNEPPGFNISPSHPHLQASSKTLSHISAWTVVNDVVEECTREIHMAKISFFLPGFFYALLPLVVRAATNTSVAGGDTWAAVVLTVLMVPVNFFLFGANFGFVVICILDFKRRARVFSRLNAILQDGYVRKPHESGNLGLSEEALSPDNGNRGTGKSHAEETATNNTTAIEVVRIDMSKSHNLLMWWYTRLILQDYGHSFLRRISFYCGYSVLNVIVIAAIMACGILRVYKMSAAGMYQAVYACVVFFMFIINVLFAGYSANVIRSQHAHTLLKKSIELSTRSERLLVKHATQAGELSRAAEFCWLLGASCREDQEVNSVRVLGIPVDIQLLGSFATIMTAAMSYGVQALIQNTRLGFPPGSGP